MNTLISRLKPANGVSYLAHLALLLLLPVVVFVLVRTGFVQLAVAIFLLSKWRMFAVRPRFWPAIIRANAVDIIVGLSIILFMTHAGSQWWQLIWAAIFAVWLVVIKPRGGIRMASLQAAIGQLFGLSAVYLAWTQAPLYGLVLATGLVCFLAARHFFDNFDEAYARMLSYLWAYFGAALSWVLGHWLLFYGHGLMAQPTLLLSLLGYGMAMLYYFDHQEKLSPALRNQFVIVMVAMVIVILAASDWADKVV